MYEKLIKDRFWSKVAIKGPDDCHDWTASICSNGYGSFCIYSITHSAHRFAWLLTKGEIPEGKLVLHRCDNKLCCNPNHLYIGTQGDNIRDREARYSGYLKGRCSSIRKEAVEEMKNMRKNGISFSSIGAKFNISCRYASMIVTNQRGDNAR